MYSVGLAGRGGSPRALEKGTARGFPFDETLFSNGLGRGEMAGRPLFSRSFARPFARPFARMDRLPGWLDIENDSSPLVPL